MTDRDILPDDVRPSHYALSLRGLDFADWTYKGSVAIKARIQRPTREIVLNAHQLKLRSATLKTPEGELASDDVVYDEPRHRATIRLPAEVAATDDATLTIEFEGVMNNNLCGFYRSRYKPAVTPVPEGVPRDDDWHYMFSTQFEACDARRAFPCWDEPNLKASFDFEIEVPADLVALSNMPVKAEREDGAAAGRKIVSFERTPVMSTYLLAWAFGDFEHIEQMTERKYDGRQLPVRVYTTRGLKEQGRWALQHAAPIIDYFSEAFGIDYPLPKADLLCTHEFAAGAMENWGLVTYRTTAVLFDEETSDASYRNRVAYVVAHELAHQWFGNLVTMDWWDELWLNEGFATWVGWHAVDRLHPDWDVWSQFVREGMGSAFSLDGIRSSHPIHVPVRDALEVDQIFDHISYLKGCSAIRMLADHVGVETFLRGVGRYLDAHKYGNAKTEALWAALSEASGKPIADLIGPWIAKIGYPVVTVAEEPAGQLTVRQNRFLTSGDVRPEEDETVWSIPLALRGKKGVEGVWKKLLQQREETIPDVESEFYKLNSGSPGFYRVNYPPERLAKLGTQLDRLGTEDRIATIGSAADLAYAGYASTTALLSFLEGFGGETNQLVWSAALGAVGRVKSIFGGDDAVREALERFVLKLIDGAVERVGLEFKDGEDYLTTMLRKQLVGSAAANGHPE
jgi:aminopeptidase N